MATFKQKLVASKVVDNRTIEQAMVEAGYSPKTASTNLTQSKGWQELMDKYLPDEKIMQKVDEGLEATKVISAIVINKKDSPTSQAMGEGLPDANSRTNDFIDVPDYAVRHKYVETSLKIKGRLVEPTDKDTPLQVNLTIDIGGTLKKIYGQRSNGSTGKVLEDSA